MLQAYVMQHAGRTAEADVVDVAEPRRPYRTVCGVPRRLSRPRPPPLTRTPRGERVTAVQLYTPIVTVPYRPPGHQLSCNAATGACPKHICASRQLCLPGPSGLLQHPFLVRLLPMPAPIFSVRTEPHACDLSISCVSSSPSTEIEMFQVQPKSSTAVRPCLFMTSLSL